MLHFSGGQPDWKEFTLSMVYPTGKRSADLWLAWLENALLYIVAARWARASALYHTTPYVGVRRDIATPASSKPSAYHREVNRGIPVAQACYPDCLWNNISLAESRSCRPLRLEHRPLHFSAPLSPNNTNSCLSSYVCSDAFCMLLECQATWACARNMSGLTIPAFRIIHRTSGSREELEEQFALAVMFHYVFQAACFTAHDLNNKYNATLSKIEVYWSVEAILRVSSDRGCLNCSGCVSQQNQLCPCSF